MKKLLAILLLILLSLSFTACGDDEDTLELNYRVGYGYYTVTGIISGDCTDIVIPSTHVHDFPVTHIDDDAFYGNKKSKR